MQSTGFRSGTGQDAESGAPDPHVLPPPVAESRDSAASSNWVAALSFFLPMLFFQPMILMAIFFWLTANL